MMCSRGLCFFILATGAGIAQQAPFTPAPRILQLHREQILANRQADYLRNEMDAVSTESRLNFQHSYLTLRGVNQTSDVWFVNGFDSYADIDQIGRDFAANADLSAALNNTALAKADLVVDPHEIFARFREDLSYGRGMSGQRTRYFILTIVSVRPGHVQDYSEVRRIIRTFHQQSNSPIIHSVYQVDSGMPDGTFLIFTPAASLDDAGAARQFDQNLIENVDSGTRAKLRDLNSAAIGNAETSILVINPAISYPSKEWVAADPDLWKR
jgi:hypothetical protein